MFRYKIHILMLFAITAFTGCADKNKPGANKDAILQKDNYDTASAVNGVFDIPELNIVCSPQQAESITLATGENAIDLDVSPAGSMTAVLIKNADNGSTIKFWRIGEKTFVDSFNVPKEYNVTALAWHPRAICLFGIAAKNKQCHILRIEKKTNGWQTKSIFSSNEQLRRLVPCPRPFIIENSQKQYFTYRLFFGISYDNTNFRIASVTESGNRFYQVIGPQKLISTFDNEDTPSVMEAPYALPVAFHPAGHQLIWEDKAANHIIANYEGRIWGRNILHVKHAPAGGTITPTPNGLGWLHWQKDKPGIGVYLLANAKEDRQAIDYNFISTPSSVPDGKGLVGMTKANGQSVVNYVPLTIPMADVVNAWMYTESKEEATLLETNSGLLRPTKHDQLFKLYETENYYCEQYDRSSPTRPYMVTTDIFWELYGAAYEGLFMIKERDEAIPAFWDFANGADKYYRQSGKASPWAPVFATLTAFNDDSKQNAEVRNIQNAAGLEYSEIFKRKRDYSELKPRGHYTATPEMTKYFKAFKYFTNAFDDTENADDRKAREELNALPADVKKYAETWIKAYTGFIASSRKPLAFSGVKNSKLAYNQFPGKGLALFPLSWGFDNEVLYTTVYHTNVEPAKQIIGAGGPRLSPSGLDLAAALGSDFAQSLSENEYKQYPPLKNAIASLQQNFKANGLANANTTLYDKWLGALAVQWIDTLSAPDGKPNEGIWQAKRLQTGLGSWATLRHATGLVNERTAAECGEGGFEEILLRAPRGYVEPDPKTFAAIADLFESSIKYVSQSAGQSKDVHESYEEKVSESLYTGIIKRLKEAAADARLFQSIAEREKRGEAITNEEYEKILFIGRVAEHNFLIFKSLANKDYALSTPDPMPKIMDVAGGGASPYLMAAVGCPMEWDNIVPFFGRREIVKGPVYSYYEFKSEQLYDDKQWSEKVKTQQYQPWVKPYVTNKAVSYPPVSGF